MGSGEAQLFRAGEGTHLCSKCGSPHRAGIITFLLLRDGGRHKIVPRGIRGEVSQDFEQQGCIRVDEELRTLLHPTSVPPPTLGVCTRRRP